VSSQFVNWVVFALTLSFITSPEAKSDTVVAVRTVIAGVPVVRLGMEFLAPLTAGPATVDVGQEASLREASVRGTFAVCVELEATEPWEKGAGRTPSDVSPDESRRLFNP
jgi:hypothetical protein